MTRSRARVDETTWGPYERVTYDALGRPATTTDTLNRTTTTAHTPATGYPASTETINPAGHKTTTVWQYERGAPVSTTDANNKVTSYTYDALGRLTAVRSPSEQTGPWASITHGYDVSPNKGYAPVIADRVLADSTRPDPYEATWTVYDSMLRERQTQTMSPASGKLVVAETIYDTRNLVRQQTSPQAVAIQTPGRLHTGVSWENSHRFDHDPQGRLVVDRYLRGGVEQWQTTTSYTHMAIQVSPPTGGDTLSVLDAYGRTVQAAEQDGTNWRTTNYVHDLAGNLRSVTDPAGNKSSYDYDMLGRRMTQDDRDAGAWSYTYDSQGNQTSATDAEGNQIHTSYDAIDRPIERRQGSPTGPRLASWTYDAAGEKGLANTATRYTPTGEWTTDVVGYDARNRPTGTTLHVPASLAGFDDFYTTTYAYDSADRVTQTTYPAVGDLPAETVTTRYNTVGLPETMVGSEYGTGTVTEEYVWGTTYDDRGRPLVRSSGSRTNWLAERHTYDTDQRLANLQGATPTGVWVNHSFGYDNVGNITERNSSISGLPWRECFDYNDLNKLVAAHTVDAADSCANGEAGEGQFGYEHAYAYSADGNLESRTEGGTTTDYDYPAPGLSSTRPHAPTLVGDDSYEWDDNGNLVERTVDGDTETLAWSAERLLESVTGPDGTTSFTYGVDGQRLVRTNPDGTHTVYLDGHEVRANQAGTSVTATRTYSYAGQLIATRTAAGVDYLLSDQQGSVEAAVPSGGNTPAGARLYQPYGNTRAGSPAGIDTDRGWLGQTEDATTDLSYLNARYYDPGAGVFISPDPLYDPARPQSLNPYAYAHGNPTTQSDPTGLWVPVDAGNGGRPRVAWHQNNFNKNKRLPGHFAGSHSTMIKMRIQPKYAKSTKYETKWNANEAFWQGLKNNPAFRAQMMGVATLNQMHSGCPTATCAGLYVALAQVGAERLIQIRQHIDEMHDAQRRVQQQKDDALASFVPAPDGGDGGGCSMNPMSWGDCASNAGNFVADVATDVWDYCTGTWQGGATCVAAVAGTAATGAGGVALLSAAGGGVGFAGTAGTVSTVAGWTSVGLQGVLTADDCSNGVDGSCAANVASTALGGLSSGLGAGASSLAGRTSLAIPMGTYSTISSGWSLLLGAPGVGGAMD